MKIFTSEVEMLRAECKEWEKVCEQHLRHIKKLKKQRQWVGLQDWEIKKMVGSDKYTDLLTAVAVAVEKTLKERNT